MLLRVYEQRKNFRYLIHATSEKNKTKKEIFLYESQKKFAGFQMIKTMLKNIWKIKFKPIDIAFDPVKHYKQIVTLLTKATSLLKRTSYSMEKYGGIECLYAFRNCLGSPVIVYKFGNQNLITYEDNFKFIDDLPFAAYFDFETISKLFIGVIVKCILFLLW